MPEAVSGEHENGRILLVLLESVERDGAQSQRKLAAELGIALGLVNAYLKRCINKGLVKIAEAPARRYAYYLTPNGFTEKSRLAVQYLSASFSFFRRARADCLKSLMEAREHGLQRIVLFGCTELAEIAKICADETGVTIVAVVDPKSSSDRYVGLPVVQSVAALGRQAEGAVITAFEDVAASVATAVTAFGDAHVFVPALLGVRVGAKSETGT